ncbi:hypothetical protein [Rickettsia bellii]|uniref:Tetratricopeptide repeat-containing domain protein n=1 Tax=Rickettsia bellii str. RML An4 TaxID=1359193 RepID=A0A0F3QA79_RICBE|nr:hypothetical protein [Rickettsia bellii]KJV89495.1 tetratricopeptide repeat-containing domain protein [Rickettsia bellii str. RML An4]
MKSNNQKELKKLQEELEVSEFGIEMDEEDASAYFKKASVLVKMFRLTDNNEYITEARRCYDKSVELAPEDKIYLTDRSKFFVSIGENSLAVDDIRKLKNLPVDSNYVLETYIQNTIDDITRLDTIQTTITKLLGEEKIDKDLADALIAHTDITARLVVQVGTHSNVLANLSNEIIELKDLIAKLYKGEKDSKKEIKKLKQKTANFEIQLKINTTIIQDHKKILENSDLIDEFQTREDLKKIQNPELQAYCKTFYWSMVNLFNAYKILSNDLIKGNIYRNEPIANKLLIGAA